MSCPSCLVPCIILIFFLLWSQAPYKLLYGLRIVNKLMTPGTEQRLNSAKFAQAMEWRARFVYRGGFDYCLQILLKRLSNLNV